MTEPGYRGAVTTDPGQSAEPSNADLLAFMQTAFAQLTTQIANANAAIGQLDAGQKTLSRSVAIAAAKVDAVESSMFALQGAVGKAAGEATGGFAAVRRDIEQVREDVAGVKADTAIAERYQADTHEAVVRHIADPGAHRPAA